MYLSLTVDDLKKEDRDYFFKNRLNGWHIVNLKPFKEKAIATAISVKKNGGSIYFQHIDVNKKIRASVK